MSDFTQSDWSVGRSYLSMGCWQGDRKDYRTGIFRSARGAVEVYEQLGNHPMTCIRTIHAGREISRHWKCVWGDRTLARLSRELLEDVANCA